MIFSQNSINHTHKSGCSQRHSQGNELVAALTTEHTQMCILRRCGARVTCKVQEWPQNSASISLSARTQRAQYMSTSHDSTDEMHMSKRSQ